MLFRSGFAAAEESVFLTKYASKVTVLVREQDFTCDATVAAAAKNNPKIEVRYQVELQGVTAGQGGLREAAILNRATGQTETWRPADGGTFGVFVFAGYVPATDLVRGVVELDDYGYVVTHGYLETSVPGVYAAGDLRAKNLRQVVTATADGAIAAVELERYAKRMSEKTGLMPQRPASYVYEQSTAKTNAASLDDTAPAPAPAKRSADAAAAANAVRKSSELFSDATRQQLNVVFGRMSRPVTLALELDDTPLSTELRGFIDALVALSGGKLKSTVVDGEYKKDDTGRAVFDVDSVLPAARPCVRMVVDGEPTGLAFHGVPSGHEFNSFVLGLYNVAGPGQPLGDDLIDRSRSITAPLDIMVLVSLTCTMCPETVLASQRIASLNPAVRAEAYDVAHFPELRDHYGAMSVPCIVITWADGTQQVEFGKKSIPQMLELVGA